MFKGRRKRTQSGPLPLGARSPPVPASAAASTAALQAFMASHDANVKLSSAAAAAALRSHTTTPTNVAAVQTKRTQRRGSITSNMSEPVGPTGRMGVLRRNSSSSMTERTFREASPGRASSRMDDAPPPLPPVPKALSPLPTKATSRQKPSPANSRVRSPQPRGPASPMMDEPSRSPASPSRASINFSRPMSPTNSPPPSPTFPKKPKPSNAKAPQPEAKALASDSSQGASTQPIKKKKKKIAPAVSEDQSLTSATADSSPRSNALKAATKAASPARGSDEATPKKTPQKKKMANGSANDGSLPETPKSNKAASNADQPRSNRASGALAKQPSVVREDREAEEKAEKASELSATSLRPLDTGSERARSSTSPGRSTHFASVALEPPAMHQPPARSASPSKSAMKYSPSPRSVSPGDGRVQNWNRPGFTPSEVSDTPSGMSEDPTRKKRASRVSFDVEPTIVGQAAETLATDSPVIASPQNDKSRKNWFSFGRDKKPSPLAGDVDEGIKPIPALPSFGSVRGKRDTQAEEESFTPVRAIAKSRESRAKTESPVQVLKSENSNEASNSESGGLQITSQPPGNEVEASESKVDEEVATESLEAKTPLEQQLEAAQPEKLESSAAGTAPAIALQPATPKLETEESERNGYIPASDAQNPADSETDPADNTKAVTSVEQESKSQEQEESLQSINADGTSGIQLPGPSQAAIDAASVPSTQNTSATVADVLAKSPPQDDTSNTAPKVEEPSSSTKDDVDEDDESGESVYSDAPSEATEMEGDGFGSINAIVGTPASQKSKAKSAKNTPESKSALERKAAVQTTPAQKPLKSALKKNEDAAVASAAAKPPAKKSVSKDATSAQALDNLTAASASAPTKTSQKRLSMRKSMRDSSSEPAAAPTSRMRTSMRGPDTREAPLRMMASYEAPPRAPRASELAIVTPASEGRLQKKSRPVSTVMPTTPTRDVSGTARARPMSFAGDGRPATATATPPVPIPSQKFAGYDSESDSSFKRARRNRSSSETRVSMRRSMRANNPEEKRFSQSQGIGPSSPSSRRHSTMKTTMRASGEPQRQRSRTPTRGIFGMGSKKLKDDPAPPPAPRFRSRIVDSDDEDEPSGGFFRSRFVDSSDEDEPSPVDLAPLRNRMKKSAVGGITDFDAEVEALMSAANSKVVPKPTKLADVPEQTDILPTSASTPALTSKTLRTAEQKEETKGDSKVAPQAGTIPERPKAEKRRSFFGTFSRRKNRSTKSIVIEDDRGRPNAARHQPSTSMSTTDGFDIASGEPTPVFGRSPVVARSPIVARSPERPSSPPKSPKLLQRRTISRTTSDAWPLPSPPATSSEQPPPMPRPTTSDGSGRMTPRASLGTRAFRSRPGSPPAPWSASRSQKDISSRDATDGPITTTTVEADAVLGRGGKKKRFQGLRKAFGLKD